MLLKFKKTKEIEENILKKIDTSIYHKQLKNILKNNYYFTEKISAPGEYIFLDGSMYHKIAIGDRGEKMEDKISKNIDEFYYEIFDNLSFNLALKLADKNRKEDYRRELFKWRLLILSTIDKDLEEKCRCKIEHILLENPYNDEQY